MTTTADNALAQWPQLGATSFCHALQHWARSTPDLLAVSSLDGSVRWTWSEFADRIRSIASGLHALGVRAGDTVALMLTNRPEFNVVDAAAIHLRAIPFSIYNTVPPDDLNYALSHSSPAVVVTESQFLDRVLAARPANIRHVILVDGSHADATALDSLTTASAAGLDFDDRWQQASRNEVVTLIYTSGTTGRPKAVQLTHANLLATGAGIASSINIPASGAVLSWLPSAHLADRLLAQYWIMMFGGSLTCVPTVQALSQALVKVRPSIFSSVPRFWEKIKASIESSGVTEPGKLPPTARAAIVAKLGLDRAAMRMTGGAPIGEDVHQFYRDLGIPLCEVWGLSEASGFSIVSPTNDPKPGWIGKPMQGVEVRVAHDGELLVRGPTVMDGYSGDPEKTADAFDVDGWLRTGDLAEASEDGHFRIVGRKKELIVTAGGKNISPANIENHIKATDPLIAHVVAVGDRRPYVVALLVLDPISAERCAREMGMTFELPAIAAHPAIRQRLAAAVRLGNEKLSRVEQIKRFVILAEDWQPGGDQLTPTAKVRRRIVNEKYAQTIDEVYGDDRYGI